MNMLYYGDNLEVLRKYIPDESVDLIYLDPPFNSQADHNILCKEQNGTYSASQIRVFPSDGMMYEEFNRLRKNPDWLSGKFIYLHDWAEKKAKRKQKQRTINLSTMGRSILPQSFVINVPSWSVFDKWLHYNFILIEELSAKTFRKTYGPRLLSLYLERLMDIALSQRRDKFTELNHYAENGFEDKDKLEMKEFVMGWA